LPRRSCRWGSSGPLRRSRYRGVRLLPDRLLADRGDARGLCIPAPLSHRRQPGVGGAGMANVGAGVFQGCRCRRASRRAPERVGGAKTPWRR
jgi:hypothetical protein